MDFFGGDNPGGIRLVSLGVFPGACHESSKHEYVLDLAS